MVDGRMFQLRPSTITTPETHWQQAYHFTLDLSSRIAQDAVIVAMANYVDEKDLEKVDMVEVTNKYAKLGISEEDATFYESFSPERQKKMLWKIDIRLVPFLALLYLCAHIDRANIGNAKIEGLVEDLGMSGIQVATPSLGYPN